MRYQEISMFVALLLGVGCAAIQAPSEEKYPLPIYDCTTVEINANFMLQRCSITVISGCIVDHLPVSVIRVIGYEPICLMRSTDKEGRVQVVEGQLNIWFEDESGRSEVESFRLNEGEAVYLGDKEWILCSNWTLF